MNKHLSSEASEQQIAKQLTEEFKRFDDAHAIEVPNIQAFEQLVASNKLEIAKRQKRDLFIFWLAALPILGLVLWMLGQHTMWFIVLQVVITVSVVIGAVVASSSQASRERKQAKWNKN